jgi:hypothetical protein
MSVTIKSVQYDALRGSHLEVGRFTLIPADQEVVISAGTEVGFTTQIPTAVGDQIFVIPTDLFAGLVLKAADANADPGNFVDIVLANITNSNITDSTEEEFNYLLFHYNTP